MTPPLRDIAHAATPSCSRGVGVRRLDHVNFLAADVLANAEFQEQLLGARPTEQIRLDSGRIAARWLTYTDKSYDVVYTEDWSGSSGRLHHIAFAADTREDILRAADLAIDTGVFIETGPHKHAVQQTFFLYVCEPGGNRIELCNPLTRLVLAPDWPLVTWTEAERAKGQAWACGPSRPSTYRGPAHVTARGCRESR
ncbi:catechol 2,3-dioxygenase-like lactoylglutathione lyase family enzyme [Streptomyces sp. DSM 40167]|nr:catechol 2,3-dioxygenase-like lactoylglutathione lyase family enzyme [Streptomyces sp. DSM 40167]